MLFETKKINSETLGEYLAEVRLQLSMTLEEVGQQTSIKTVFLHNLEQGNLNLLPPDVYVLGFLKQLSLLYSIELNPLIDQYKKERSIEQQYSRGVVSPVSKTRQYLKNLIVTPTLLSVGVGVLFIVGTLVYVIWQVLSINKAPSLEIMQPQDRQMIKDSYVNVQGKTDPGITITINDQNVFVDAKGNFQTQLGLAAGPENLVFVAKNKFNKIVTQTVSVVGQNIPQPTVLGAHDVQFQLKLQFTDTVNLSFAIDDAPAQTLTFENGDSKIFNAHNKIIITTSNAGATTAVLDGQNLGVLGRPHETLNDIPFFPKSDMLTASTTP